MRTSAHAQSAHVPTPNDHCKKSLHGTRVPPPSRRAVWTCIIGAGALLWLIFRSGTKPSRLSYPCQQSAFGLATVAFGAPVVAAVIAGRGTLLGFVRSRAGKLAGFGIAVLTVVLVAYAAHNNESSITIASPPADHHPAIYLINNAQGVAPDRFGGIDDLVKLMGLTGFKWYRSDTPGPMAGPDGLINHDDVVLVKINAQWGERGGTNTDVLRGILRRIVEHPDGFVGEIVVADNGQGYGSLDRSLNNAEDQSQSPQDVVNDFAGEGWSVSTKLWDNFRTRAASEFSVGDMSDGYILSSNRDVETGVQVSYPKFRTSLGTYISYKRGIWDPISQTYDHDRLVVLNVPILKTHSIYGVTGAVKNHMGVVTQSLGTDSHNCVYRGGLGSVMAEVRRPDLTILDCIWVLARPGLGPGALYGQASRRDQLVASTDPVALDAWAVTNILVPQILANGYTFNDYGQTQDPDNLGSTFRQYLDRSMNELLIAGIPTTNDYNAVQLYMQEEGASIPTVSDWGLIALSLLLLSTGSMILRDRVKCRGYPPP